MNYLTDNDELMRFSDFEIIIRVHVLVREFRLSPFVFVVILNQILIYRVFVYNIYSYIYITVFHIVRLAC